MEIDFNCDIDISHFMYITVTKSESGSSSDDDFIEVDFHRQYDSKGKYMPTIVQCLICVIGQSKQRVIVVCSTSEDEIESGQS